MRHAGASRHEPLVLGSQILDGRGLDGLGAGHLVALAWSVSLIAWLIVHTLGVTAKVVAE
ncbi:hypothetical protein ACQP1K_00050 [Sphaerimonospora sp. CA-214678]|uniref:hypothetical protein n=1 Tax=Sphaerimonospora sp. CA-214678 TaxID=3240029 RepID=UPI003D8A54AC